MHLSDTTFGTGDHAVADFDVHGLVRIRLSGAPPRILQAVGRQLGQAQLAAGGKPDIHVTFVDELPPVGHLKFLGLRQAAYDDEHFYLLDVAGKRARVDLSQLGEQCEIVCEREIGHIPLLIQILGLHLLRKEHVMLHAASFVYRDKGVLVAGWQKGGKTETMLPFMAAGAEFVADEWTIVGGAEPTLFGISNVSRIWDWHLRHLPEYWPRIERSARTRLRVWRLYRRLFHALPLDRVRGRVVRRLRRVSMDGGAAWQGVDHIDPSVLFGNRVRQDGARLDRVFLPVVGIDDDVEVLAIEGSDIARRMVSSLAFERGALTTAYLQFRFAFPDRVSPLIETASAEEERLLGRCLANVPAFELRHPYPVALRRMYDAAKAYC
jgi:hypothetical protein